MNLIFDMDGTIADFYNVENWLQYLEEESTVPYEIAKPMYNMKKLSAILKVLQNLGNNVSIVSWGSKGATQDFNKRIRIAKKNWLDKNNFPYNELHVVQYGTPKQKFIKRKEINVLFDDNAEIRKNFLKSNISAIKQVIPAETADLLQELVKILLEV